MNDMRKPYEAKGVIVKFNFHERKLLLDIIDEQIERTYQPKNKVIMREYRYFKSIKNKIEKKCPHCGGPAKKVVQG